jgi:hypothetical protein
MIQLDRAGKTPEDEIVRAVHVEVDRTHRNEAKNALQEIYSANATEWPLHLRLRAVPLLKDVLNGHVKKDIHRLIGRQASFNDEEFGKRKINTWEIKELDFASSTSGKSLRDFIMAIPRKNDPTRKLFHSADHLRSNRSTVVLTCMPAMEPEARDMIASLLPYLKEQHGDQVLEFFTKDAQLRAIDSFWDASSQCVRNKDDSYVSQLFDGVDSDYILPPVRKQGSTPSDATPIPARPLPTQPTPHSLQRNTFGDDTDSIGTFRRETARDSISVASSTDSATTIATLTSRISALEAFIQANNIVPPTTSPPSSVDAEGLAIAGGPIGERTLGDSH